MVEVNWSAGSPSTPTVQVQIPQKLTVLSVSEKNENKEKGAGVGPFLKDCPHETKESFFVDGG